MKNKQLKSKKKYNKIILFIMIICGSLIFFTGMFLFINFKRINLETEVLINKDAPSIGTENNQLSTLSFDLSQRSLEEKIKVSNKVKAYFKSFPIKKYSILLENETFESSIYESTYLVIPKEQAMASYKGSYEVFQKISIKTEQPFHLNDEWVIAFQKNMIGELPIPSLIENEKIETEFETLHHTSLIENIFFVKNENRMGIQFTLTETISLTLFSKANLKLEIYNRDGLLIKTIHKFSNQYIEDVNLKKKLGLGDTLVPKTYFISLEELTKYEIASINLSLISNNGDVFTSKLNVFQENNNHQEESLIQDLNYKIDQEGTTLQFTTTHDLIPEQVNVSFYDDFNKRISTKENMDLVITDALPRHTYTLSYLQHHTLEIKKISLMVQNLRGEREWRFIDLNDKDGVLLLNQVYLIQKEDLVRLNFEINEDISLELFSKGNIVINVYDETNNLIFSRKKMHTDYLMSPFNFQTYGFGEIISKGNYEIKLPFKMTNTSYKIEIQLTSNQGKQECHTYLISY